MTDHSTPSSDPVSDLSDDLCRSPLYGYSDGNPVTKDYIAELFSTPSAPIFTPRTRSQKVELVSGLDLNHRDRRHSSTDNNLLLDAEGSSSGSNTSVVTCYTPSSSVDTWDYDGLNLVGDEPDYTGSSKRCLSSSTLIQETAFVPPPINFGEIDGDDITFTTIVPSHQSSPISNRISPISRPTSRMESAEIKSQYVSILTAKAMAEEEDLDTVDLLTLPGDYVKDLVKQSEDWKRELRKCVAFLELNDSENFSGNKKEEILKTKTTFVNFVKRGLLFLKDKENTQETLNVSLTQAKQSELLVKETRVANRKDKLVNNIQSLIDDFGKLNVTVPETDQQATKLLDKFSDIKLQADDVIKDAKDLSKDATDINSTDQAVLIDDMVQQLKEASIEAKENLIAIKDKFGLVPSSGIKSGSSDAKKPMFSGDSSKEDQLDFYTFQDDFWKYIGTRTASSAEQLRILTQDCLTGRPKTSCKNLKSVDEVFKLLKKRYGNPKTMFDNKLEEIKKLGACPFSLLKQREWFETVHEKVEFLVELCDKFELNSLLFHSGISADIRTNLPKDLLKDITDELTLHADEYDMVPLETEFKCVRSFIDRTIQTSTIHMNLSKPEPKVEQVKKTPVEVKVDKKAVKKTYQSTSSPQVADGQRQRQPRGGGQVRDGQSGGAPRGNKTKPKANAKPSQSTPAASGSTTRPKTPALTFSGAEKPATEKNCKNCSGQHSLLYYCPTFLSTPIRDRAKVAATSNVCYRCLRLDSKCDLNNIDAWWDSHKNDCRTEFVCNVDRCAFLPHIRQRNILLCSWHESTNKDRDTDLLATLESSKIPPGSSLFFGIDMTIFNMSNYAVEEEERFENKEGFGILPDIASPGIFMLQDISPTNEPDRKCVIFYDTGCGTAAISNNAVSYMDTETVREGPSYLHVAGGSTIKLEGGDERFWLEMAESKSKATITGLNVPSLTCSFPLWDLRDAYRELKQEYEDDLSIKEPLPTVPDTIGGQAVDIMLGIRYIVYFPKLVYHLPHGLGIYKSVFKGTDGHQGVLGGPHQAWFEAVEASNFLGASAYLTCEMKAYQVQSNCLKFVQSGPECEDYFQEKDEIFIDDEVETISANLKKDIRCEFHHCDKHSKEAGWMIPRNWDLTSTIYNVKSEVKFRNDIEVMGSEAEYRCITCRNCNKCRKGDLLEQVSLQEELEQAMIEESVVYIPEEKRVEAVLPFLDDPLNKLKPNKHIAYKILESQMRLFEKNPEMRLDALKSHDKLQTKGHVVRMKDLSEAERSRMNSTPGEGYYIPWRLHHKQNSINTPCRMVFDASSRTPNGGESLNALLAKGQNLLVKILHLLIRFKILPYAFTCDVSMAYNQIKLAMEFYKFQKYLWINDLQPGNPVEEMIVRTLIYGVKSSGNQIAVGFERLSSYCEIHHPEFFEGARVLRDNTYVDDVLDSSLSEEERERKIAGIKFTLDLGLMSVKGFTRSGQSPSEELSTNGSEVGALGYLWNPLDDDMILDIKQLSFGKARRGKRPEPVVGDILESLKINFTKRNLLSVTSGVFDPLGYATPVTAKFKLDMHTLVKLNLGWDDLVPQDYLRNWVENFEVIQKLGKIRFHRTVIPVDAAECKIELIVSVDASEKMGIAAVHSRVLRTNGEYHVQLVAAKSKIVSGSTIPRGELKAAVVGSILGHVVKINLGDFFKDILYVTDSTIILHWIHQDERPMQVGVRNSVIEIRRFSLKTSWFHIETDLNIADLGTRGAETEQINETSEWQCGKLWMSGRRCDMPIKNLDQVKLTADEKRQVASELKGPDVVGYLMSCLKDRVQDRYSFSKYILDPCRFPWSKVINTMCMVRRFCFSRPGTALGDRFNQRFKIDDLSKPFSPEEIDQAEYYFFRKGSLEVQKFSKHKDWKHCSEWKDGLLLYTGRILDGQEVLSMENCMLDVKPLTFVKPILDRYSPIAYSIMIHSHEKLVKHRSSSFTLRESRYIAYILGGRDLAIEVREACVFCRRYKARMVKTEMGKIHENRLTIAPVFWNVQIDIMGPFLAHCEHNHRSSVKIWGLVFKDPASGAVYTHVMQGYDASSFVLAYTRFACRFGHPNQIFIDEGSQLIKGCKDMEISWTDISKTLNGEYKVGLNFKTCPVGGHNFNGVVERSIKEIKKIFYTVYNGLQLDILAYETAFGWVSNELNNLPICLGSKTENLDNLDLITPQRLISGMNNSRAPQGPCRIEAPSRLIKQMDKVYESWWRNWTMEKIINYIPRPPQWTKNTYQPKIGDIVIFRKDENDKQMGSRVWRTGRVKELDESRDDISRSLIVEYKNASESVFRTTRRSVRKVAVVHVEHDLELIQELNEACKEAGNEFYMKKISETESRESRVGDQLGENFIHLFSSENWPMNK